MTGGTYRPVAELLQISIQICEILHEAHQRNIVYRDHKILHYYWIEPAHGVYVDRLECGPPAPRGTFQI